MFEDLPPSIYIGIGAIVAAVITALISFVNLITSKDQIISNNRQKWIDSIRNDISNFIGLSSLFSARYDYIESIDDLKERHKLQTECFTSAGDISESFNRIILQLNPKENQKLILALHNIEEFLAGDTEYLPSDTEHMGKLTKSLREISQDMLKQEWKRVKRGEPTYIATKYSFIIMIIFSIAFGAYKLNNYVLV